jgi:hypothetical protein
MTVCFLIITLSWFLTNESIRSKGKAFPLQACRGPEFSRRLRIPDFKTIGTCRLQGCQPYALAAFTPSKYSWYSFLLEAESTPEPFHSEINITFNNIRNYYP